MRRWAVAAALWLVACASPAPSPIPAASLNPATRPDDHGLRGPFLWEVQGDGATSYLFGTIHVGVDPASGLPEMVRDRLRRSRVFICETDLRKIDAGQVMALASLESGQTLDRLIGDAPWKSLTAMVGGRVPEERLRSARPWYAMVAILQSLYPTPSALDAELLAQAEAEGKELVFLEAWRFQIELLDDITGASDVIELLDETSRARVMLDRMMKAYQAGDFEALTVAVLDPQLVAEAPAEYARLFDDRNRAWLELLARPLTEGNAFVAVGVGHFAGENGLVELLRARGFIVRRRVK